MQNSFHLTNSIIVFFIYTINISHVLCLHYFRFTARNNKIIIKNSCGLVRGLRVNLPSKKIMNYIYLHNVYLLLKLFFDRCLYDDIKIAYLFLNPGEAL